MQPFISSSFCSFNPIDNEPAPLVDLLGSVPRSTGPIKAGAETWSCAWPNDSSYFAWSCGHGIVRLIPWDMTKNNIAHLNENGSIQTRTEHTIDCGEFVWSVAFGSATSDNRSRWRRFVFTKDLILATGLQNGHIKLWDCYTANLLMDLLDHRDVVSDMHFAPDNSLIMVSASRDGTLKLWDLNDDGNMMKTLRTEALWVYGCSWSPNANTIASVGTNRSVQLWSLKDRKLVRKLLGHYHDVVSCQFSPDGALLATASFDTRVITWDPDTGDIIHVLYHLYPPPSAIFAGGANDNYARSVCFSPCGMRLITVADDGYVRFWDLHDTTDPIKVAESQNALCCRYAKHGTIASVGTRNGRVFFYAPPTRIASLQHLSRMEIRRLIPSTSIDFLHLPLRLKEYIKYKVA